MKKFRSGGGHFSYGLAFWSLAKRPVVTADVDAMRPAHGRRAAGASRGGLALVVVVLGSLSACGGSDDAETNDADPPGVAAVSEDRTDEGSSSESSAPAPDPNAFDLTNVPENQRGALEDGVLTTEEYRQAFEDFRECSADAGVEISGGAEDPDTGRIQYSYPGERAGYEQGEDPLVIAVEDCYVEHFRAIDATFQTTDPEVLDQRRQDDLEFYEEFVKPCLELNGIEAPEVLPANSDQEARVAVMRPFSELQAEGRCE